MPESETEEDRIAATIVGQRPPPMGDVVGMPGGSSATRGASQDERVEAFEKQEKDPQPQERPPEPDAEDILRAAGYKVASVSEDDENAGWSQTPSIKTQYIDPRFISTVSEGAEITKQYRLDSTEQTEALNLLKKRAAKTGAPEVVILIEDRNFADPLGSYVVLLVYKEIFYRSIIENK